MEEGRPEKREEEEKEEGKGKIKKRSENGI